MDNGDDDSYGRGINIDASIPDSLKEQPTVDNYTVLDEQFAQLLEDIQTLETNRKSVFNLDKDPSSSKVPLIPSLGVFEEYKLKRQKKLDEVTEIRIPKLSATASQAAAKEMKEYWKLDDEFEHKKLRMTLASFYQSKAGRVLTENSLLMSRYARFCKSAADTPDFFVSVKKHQTYLQGEYEDAVKRYEKLVGPDLERRHSTVIQIRRDEKEQIEKERRGEASFKDNDPSKQDPSITNMSKSKPEPSKTNSSKSKPEPSKTNLSKLESSKPDPFKPGLTTTEDHMSPEYDLSDLAVFTRELICRKKAERDVNIFFLRVKVLPHLNRVNLFRDYHLISQVKPAEGRPDVFGILEGINDFVETIPLKLCKIEDFLTEVDILCSHWKIETPISREDGRSFVYEIESIYRTKFHDQVLDSVLPPYDTFNYVPNDKSPEKGKEHLDKWTKDVAEASGYFDCLNAKKSHQLRLRPADWLHRRTFVPQIQPWQRDQQEVIRQQRDIDMELKFENCLLVSNDYDFVLARLKDSAKRLFEQSAAIPNSRAREVKMIPVNQQKEYHIPPEPEMHFHKGFDLGMCIPNGRLDQIDTSIIDAKKDLLEDIIEENEDIRKIEHELINADPTYVQQGSNMTNPTIATLFSEHEIFAFLLMRNLRLRELRDILLGQLNFFRSIERRITIDAVEQNIVSDETNVFNDRRGSFVSGEVTAMMRRMSMFDVPDTITDKGQRSKKSLSDDYRGMSGMRPTTLDESGTPFIYDKSFEDRKDLEDNLIRVATHYICGDNAKSYSSSRSYIDELRFRMSDKRHFSDQLINNSSYLNPGVDRSQFLLELYTNEVEFQFAKMKLAQSYMEIYEHSTEASDRNRVCQVLTDMIALRPDLSLSDGNFSKSYTTQIKSLELHSALVDEMSQYAIKSYREWMNRLFLNQAERRKSNVQPNVMPGLPKKTDDLTQEITMHHQALSVKLTENVCTLPAISKVFGQLVACCNEVSQALSQFLGKTRKLSASVVECVILKEMLNIWEGMSTLKFKSSQRTRRLVGNIEGDSLLENPRIVDLVLSECYADRPDFSSPLFLSASFPMHKLNDPGFQAKGIETLRRLTKCIIKRDRLLYSWVETEYWRMTAEYQYKEFRLPKATYAGRMENLRFDEFDSEEPTAIIQDEQEDDVLDFAETFNSSTDQLKQVKVVSGKNLRFTAPTFSEFDETHSPFDFDDVKEFQGYIKPNGLKRLSLALRLQLPDRNWLMAACELQSLLLAETHFEVFKEDLAKRLYPSTATGRKLNGNNASRAEADSVFVNLDVDYRVLVPNIINKKKVMRKLIINDYKKEYKNIRSKEYATDAQRDSALSYAKTRLIDWFCENMEELANEECQKAEFAKLCRVMGTVIYLDPYGTLTFVSSKVKKNADFFRIYEEKEGVLNVKKQSSKAQEMCLNDAGTETNLASLWYTPHLTEILAKLAPVEITLKPTTDTSKKLFRNSFVYGKSLEIYTMLYQTYMMIKAYAKMLQSSQRYSAHVKELREADYIVNVAGSIKKEIMSQGEKADYNRVKRYMLDKWQYWYLRVNIMLSTSIHSLEMNLIPDASRLLQSYHKSLLDPTHSEMKLDFEYLFDGCSKICLRLPKFAQPDLHAFAAMTHAARRICDSNVINIEESLDGQLQILSFENVGSTEDRNSALLDFLRINYRLHYLRRDFLRYNSKENFIKDEREVDYISKLYKMRILVPATKLYYRIGAKGSATIESLLAEEPLLDNTSKLPLSALESFERCQITVLKNEVYRRETLSMIEKARAYFDRLSEECLGRLFKTKEAVQVPSSTSKAAFAFDMDDDDYHSKAELLTAFMCELHKISAELTFEKRGKPQEPMSFNEKAIFACRREKMADALYHLALNLGKWQSKRRRQEHEFEGKLYGHLLQLLQRSDKMIRYMAYTRDYQAAELAAKVKLQVAQESYDILAELSSAQCELSELKKSRRIDERKMRVKIVDEYDALVQELVNEITVLRNRFHEYQMNNFHEVMQIMAESKKSELHKLSKNTELPLAMRESAKRMIKQETEVELLRDENHELQMTLLKIRSMYSIKEQALKTVYDKKIRTLEEANKTAEEKMWDSFRESEGRERVLRKELHKMQRQEMLSKASVEKLQRLLRDEQQKSRLGGGLAKGAEKGSHHGLIDSLRGVKSEEARRVKKLPSDSIIWTGEASQDELSFYQIKDKLKHYERIQIDSLLYELTNKTHLIECMIDEKKAQEILVRQTLPPRSKSPRRNVTSPTHSQRPPYFPDLRWSINVKDSTTDSGAVAAEPYPRRDISSRSNEVELHRLRQAVESLAETNQGLVKSLKEHDIPLPSGLEDDKSHVVGGKVSFNDKMPKIHGSLDLSSRASSARTHRPASSRPEASPFVIPQLGIGNGNRSRPVSALARVSKRDDEYSSRSQVPSRPVTASTLRPMSSTSSKASEAVNAPRFRDRPTSGFPRPMSSRSRPHGSASNRVPNAPPVSSLMREQLARQDSDF